MKRTFTLLLTLIMLVMLAACGTEAATGDPVTLSPTAGADNVIKNESTEEPKIAFEEITVVDNEYCTIKITDIEPDNIWGYTLKAYLENKSEDKTFMFSIESAAINGVQADPFFATEVAAGKMSNKEISFSDSNLSANGIHDFTDIALTFRVYDSDDWSADNVALETVHVYPFGEEKATAFVRENLPTDTVIVDNDNVTVIVTGYAEDTIWGYTLNLYLVNKTDKELMYSVDEASVNGFMADPFWATSVSAGNVAFTSMAWSDSTFEENSITNVEEIEMKFRIYNSDDWNDEDIFNETITLNP